MAARAILLCVLAFLLVIANSPISAMAYLSTAPAGDRTWYWQNPEPQGNQLLDASFVSPSVGWAVGQSGTLLMTDSGGVVWEAQDSGTASDLRGVSFVDALNGWAVGGNGVIVHTTDGGITWSAQTSGTTTPLRAVDFFDANNGVAVGTGGRIIRTADGGATWTTGNSNTGEILYGVSMASASTGWAVGASGTICKTTNGGATWTIQKASTSLVLSSIYAIDTNTALLVGASGTVARTTNGGTSWTKPSPGTTVALYDISFASATDGWLVGTGGAISHTTDGGVTWTSQNSGTATLRAVAAGSSTSAHAFGDFGTSLRTNDGGSTWQSDAGGTAGSMYSVDFVDLSNGWAVGDGGALMRSTDGGDSWETLSAGKIALRGVDFIDLANGIAVGDGGRIVTTANGGTTWTTRTSGTTQNLRSVCYANSTTAWAVGETGAILRTMDGGVTWTTQTSGTNAILYSVDALSDTDVWVAGQQGVVKHTTSGGSTWTTVDPGTNRTFRCVEAVDASHVYLAGASGTLRYTANGGVSWTAQAPGVSTDIYAVGFGTAQAGWFVGADGVVGYTTNGGTSWTPQQSGTKNSLYDIHSADASTAWAVGANATVRHTNDAGTSWQSLSYGTVENLNDITFTDALNGWAVGANGMVRHTHDGGLTWRTLSAAISNALYAVAFTSDSAGVIVGQAGSIKTTSDGGVTWTTRSSGVSQTLRDVAFWDASNGIAVGDTGRILTTGNGGATWSSRTSGTNVNLKSVSVLDSTHAWVVGDGGRLLFSANGGQTWATRPSGVSVNLTGVKFVSATTGWFVGTSGTVRTTSNGGSSWTAQTSGTTRNLTSVSALDANRVWAAGLAGTILKSSDGGATWTNRPTGLSTDVNSINVLSATSGWAVGTGGTTVSTAAGAAPVTTAFLDPNAADGIDDWYVSPVTLTLQRDVPGVTRYSAASGIGPWSTYAGPVTLADGYHTVWYYSADTAGTVESAKSISFKVDTTAPTAPTVGATPTGSTTADVTFSASSDAGSGFAYYDVLVNGSRATTTTANTVSLTDLTPATVYAVSVVAVDAAGNRSLAGDAPLFTTQALETSPFKTEVVVDPALPDGSNDWYQHAPTITLSSDPAALVHYSWDSAAGPWSDYASALTASAGESTFSYYASDSAIPPVRLDETVRSLTFKVDEQAPSAPGNLVGYAPSARTAQLVWDNVYDATSGTDQYHVYQLTGSDWTMVGSSSEASITIGGLDASASHTFRVTAIDLAGNESVPSESAAVTDLSSSPADPPQLVAARAVSGNAVYVSWSEASQTVGPVTYHVWRSEDSDPYVHIAAVDGALHRSFVDDQASSSHDYVYEISVEDSRGEGVRSAPSVTDLDAPAAHTYPPSAPGALKATALPDGTVSLEWTAAHVPNLTGYVVLRALSQGGEATTLTADPVATTAYVDASTAGRPFARYWYRVASVDDKGEVGAPTIDAYVRTLGVSGTAAPHATFAQPDSDNCNKCHSLHGSKKSNHLLAQESATALCDTCHDGTGAALSIVNDIPQDGTGSSHGMGTRADPGATLCTDCHNPHFAGAASNMNNLLASKETTSGVDFCYSCHGENSTLPGGDMRSFQQTGHEKGIVAPNGMSSITCAACHQSHGSAAKSLLTENADYTTCLQCHSASGNNPDAPDKQYLLDMSADSSAHLPLLGSDQSATGARLSCVNCHNPHRTTPQDKVIDPYSPNTVWTGSRIDFCLSCHKGDPLPNASDIGTSVPEPLGAGGATTLPDIARSYLATDSAETTLSPHGVGDSSYDLDGTPERYVRDSMGYQVGDVLTCETCHEQHGGANAFALRGSISSKDGSIVQRGLLVIKLPNDEGYDMRFFCSACHVMKASEHPTGPLSAQPMDCTGCHSHGHGRL